MKKRSISLFLGLMLAAAGAQAGGLGDAIDVLKAAGNTKGSITFGSITGKSKIDADAEAQGKGSEAMAGGVISATPSGQDGINAKVTIGVIDNSAIKAKAKASDGGSAYAGGVISK
ncbi:MAG: hypothetical protein Q4G28_07365 [Neisseria sp.]|nr:hypothetical protein [Neisseria sp.]